MNSIVTLLAGLLVGIALFLAPIAFGAGGSDWLLHSLTGAMAFGLALGLSTRPRNGVVFGLLGGLALTLSRWEVVGLVAAANAFPIGVASLQWTFISSLLVAIAASFSTGLFMGMIAGAMGFPLQPDPRLAYKLRLSQIILAVAAGSNAIEPASWSFGWGALLPLISWFLATMLALQGVRIGIRLGYSLSLGVEDFGKVGPYLKVMAKPVLGFAVTYLLMVLGFAGWFASIERLVKSVDPNSSAFDLPNKSAGFGDFLYFSLMTAATVGYGDITPTNDLTKALVMVEVVAGLTWTVVIFAALIAYLTPRFQEIANQTTQGIAEANVPRAQQGSSDSALGTAIKSAVERGRSSNRGKRNSAPRRKR